MVRFDTKKWFAIFTVFMVMAGLSARARGEARPFVWIESEQPTSANVKPDSTVQPHAGFLSGGKWLLYVVNARAVPADGVLVSYAFNAPADGKYTVWNRVAFDSIRTPFAWRIDGGEWTDIPHEHPTIDLMDLADFEEISWLNMGQAQLTKGQHTLEIRAVSEKNAAGQPQHVVYGSDAMCLSQGDWTPFSKFKPGEDSQTPADLAAGKKVFDLPDSAGPGQRSTVALQGTWEIARAPEHYDDPADRALRPEDLGADLHWSAITVPSDKNARPDLLMAHTFVYRTRINVPASAAGRSVFITFPLNCLNTTVYCNGTYCGFNKNPLAPFSIDLTAAIKPGQVNVIEVPMRDVWYGFEKAKGQLDWPKHFLLPLRLFSLGFQPLIYPIWGFNQSGILETPVVTLAGPAYVSDVFVKPSVAKHELAAEVTLENPTAKAMEGQVVCEAIDVKTGKTEKTLPAQPFTIQPGAEQVVNVSGGWANPTLWWPDAPHLYTLRTTVQIGGQPVDISDQRFGFRQWTIDGIHFKLNGVIFHGWAENHTEATPADWLAVERQSHQNTFRFWGVDWLGLNEEQVMDFMDENGIVVRRSERLDGDEIGYLVLPDLFPNWRDQLVQEVKSERNHPSLMIYSIENEFRFINLFNSGSNNKFEPLMDPAAEAVAKLDPTHPIMTDGGGADMVGYKLPVHGDHYIEFNNQTRLSDEYPLTQYPDMAYQPNVTGGGRGRWTWDMKEPRFLGEGWWITGNHPELADIGGEDALAGKTASRAATGKIITICQQGYRWDDYGAWTFWMGPADSDSSEYNSMSPRAVFCRQWDWTFASGATVPRTMAIFNDTHYDDPITLNWSLLVGGKPVAGASSVHTVTPGTKEVLDIQLPMPTVTERTEGQLILTLAVNGNQVFKDTKDVSILPAILTDPQSPAAGGLPASANSIVAMPAGKLAVFDPAGSAIGFLKQHHVAFTELHDLKTLPPDAKTLLIGKDALSAADAVSTRFAVYAQESRSVIVLEQAHPLKYQALPAQMAPAENVGRVAFLNDLDSPLSRGLAQKDLFTWGPDEIVYRNAYRKPEQGGRSLIECDDLLQYTSLVDLPVGKGMMLLSQLALEEKLPGNAVAQQLLANLLNYGSTYELKVCPVTLTTPAGSPFGTAVAGIGVQEQPVDDALAAIAEPGKKIALITASPENLAKLADNPQKVDAFTAAGGWILFNDLTPAGLASYNKIVGVDHLIRPYGGTPSLTNAPGPMTIERVAFSDPRNPLTAGMALGDIVQYSGQPVFRWQSGNYVSPDEFSYIVDYDDIAPFAKSPFRYYGNITNGFTNADGWPFIVNGALNADGSPVDIAINLPRPETIVGFTWIGNSNYYSVDKVNLLFDGKSDGMATYNVRSDSQPMHFAVNPPRKVSSLTLQLAGWTAKAGKQPFYGIDNIYLKVARSPEFYAKVKPMLNIGGMMEYPRGKGGIILCNLLFKDREEVPVNLLKKRAVLAALLHNLDAGFAAKTVIVGSHLEFTPIDISKQANQYRTDRGWFGDPRYTFADLPTGEQTFNGVQYDIYDFPTSPVPTAIMLDGKGIPNHPALEVKGIPVNRKADALFFLQTARIDKPLTAIEIRNNSKFVLFKYVIHYADGQTAEVPVIQDWSVGDYRQTDPQSLPGAVLAWSSPYARTQFSAAAWTQQWNNPRPSAEIASIDVVYGPDKRAVPAVLAISAATAP